MWSQCLFLCMSLPLLADSLENENMDRQLHVAGVDNVAVGVESLDLLDALREDAYLQSLFEGSTINLEATRSYSFHIQAAVHGEVASVVFGGDLSPERVDSVAPFTLTEEPLTLTPGTYSLTAAAYSLPDGVGDALASMSITVEVVSDSEGVLNVPELRGGWIENALYPVENEKGWVGECQGAMMDNSEFLVVAGFIPPRYAVTRDVQSLNVATGTWKAWQRIPVEIRDSVTHAGFVAVGRKFYMCGGYLGTHPGPEMDECYVLDMDMGAEGTWITLPSLPARRGGGGMVYDETFNCLIFSLGADRPFAGSPDSEDHADTYRLDLDDLGAGWKTVASAPFAGNHVSFVTIKDCSGNPHHLFLGGQEGEDEYNGNLEEHYEYDVAKDQWTARAYLPQPRGHMASSTRAYSCGLIVVGGTIDSDVDAVGLAIASIDYYDYDTNKWTKIGDYVNTANTPLCDIALDVDGADWLYCGLGYRDTSHRREIWAPEPTVPVRSGGGPIRTLFCRLIGLFCRN